MRLRICSLFTLHIALKAMSCSRRSCCNDPDKFCYICGEYIQKVIKNLLPILYVRRTLLTLELSLTTKTRAPHVVCKACIKHIRMWANRKTKSFRFSVPMIWREPKNCFDYCYFCMVDLKRFNRHKKNS